MKKKLYILIILCLTFVACGEKQQADMTQMTELTLETETEMSQETVEISKTEETGEQEIDYNPVVAESETGGIDFVVYSFGWLEKTVYLLQVQEFLDSEGIHYQGIVNRSGERVDLILEDGSKLIFLSVRDSQRNVSDFQLIQSGDIFDKKGFLAIYEKDYDTSSNKEYGPDTSTQLIDDSEWRRYSQTDLSIYRNQIYARHGRMFDDPFLCSVFSSKAWYLPQYDAASFAEKEGQLLNDIERENINLIVQIEYSNEYRKRSGETYDWPVAIISGSWLDLDGDGVKEQIYYKNDNKSEANINYNGYQIQAGSSIISEEGSVHNWLYIASLDGEKTQLLVAYMRDGDDGQITAYSFEDGGLKKEWSIPGVPSSVEITAEGVYTYEYTIQLQCRMTKRLYRMKDGNLVEEEREFYEHGNEVKALIEIPTYGEKGGSLNGVVIQPGDTVVIMGGDNKEWLCIKKKISGEIGWIKTKGADYVQPDGTTKWHADVFDGLTIFG